MFLHEPSTGLFSSGSLFGVLFEEYERRQAEEDALVAGLTSLEMVSRRDEFLVSVGRAAGVFLNVLARESHARSLLELGTGFGYSTIWLAEAARSTGGRVLSIDLVPDKQQYARAALQRVDLLDVVQLKIGDAIEFLRSTDQTFDFVLLDLWKDVYIPCFDALLNHLQPGATIVADNMTEPAVVRLAAAKYQAHLRGIPDVQTVVLSVGNGLAVSRYQVQSRLTSRESVE
jgi:predicted O-methyltransferase YrrM